MTANVYANAADALERSRPRSVCKWVPADLDEGTWESNCGERHTFTVDGPEENGFSYCPYCGDVVQEHWPKAYATNLGRPDEPPEIVAATDNGDDE